jgi:tripartite-type tricarboxylate transporter receptor subunit TctC
VCDVQERFRALIWRFPAVLAGAATLCRVAALLELPATVTEQNPARLGATVAEVAAALGPDAAVLPKMAFSMATPEVRARLTESLIDESDTSTAAFREEITRERRIWADVIRNAGIRVEG